MPGGKEQVKAGVELDADVRKYQRGMRQARGANKEVTKSLGDLANTASMVGGALTLLGGIIIRQTVRAAVQLESSLIGLSSVARAFGQDVDKAKQAAIELASDGLVPVSDASEGLKNLLMTGIGLPKAVELMGVFKDRAAFGRSAALDMGTAVRNLSQAFKTEQSMLGDASGMAENFNQILDEGSKIVGTHVKDLKGSERALAKYFGILKLSQPFIGDTTRYTESFAGAQSELTATTRELREEMGKSLIPTLKDLYATITPAVKSTKDWIGINPQLVASLVGAGGVLSALTMVLGVGYKLKALFSGPLAVAFMALVGMGVGIAALRGHAADLRHEATKSTREFINQQKAIKELQTAFAKAVAAKDMQRMRDILEKFTEIAPEVADALGEIGDSANSAAEAMERMSAAAAELARAQLVAMKDELKNARAELQDIKEIRREMGIQPTATTFAAEFAKTETSQATQAAMEAKQQAHALTVRQDELQLRIQQLEASIAQLAPLAIAPPVGVPSPTTPAAGARGGMPGWMSEIGRNIQYGVSRIPAKPTALAQGENALSNWVDKIKEFVTVAEEAEEKKDDDLKKTYEVEEAFAGMMGSIVSSVRSGADLTETLFNALMQGIAMALTSFGGPIGGIIGSFFGGMERGGVLQGMQHGGVVVGGIQGRDSVLAALAGHEGVVPAEFMPSFGRMLGAFEKGELGGNTFQIQAIDAGSIERLLFSTGFASSFNAAVRAGVLRPGG